MQVKTLNQKPCKGFFNSTTEGIWRINVGQGREYSCTKKLSMAEQRKTLRRCAGAQYLPAYVGRFFSSLFLK